MSWRPGQRKAALALESPFEDVPSHLWPPLWSWASQFLAYRDVIQAIGLAMRISLPDPDSGNGHEVAISQLERRSQTDHHFFLSLTEWLVENCADYRQLLSLDRILELANSAFTVDPGAKTVELRVLPEVKNQVQKTVTSAKGSAGIHLADAWSAAYSLKADPVKAYSEAIKAVESAAAPVISPANLKATLGTMIRALRSDLHSWEFEISSGGSNGSKEILDLMALLWGGQTSRHGGVRPTVPETPEAARAAVHLAATLVQFFTSGAICKK